MAGATLGLVLWLVLCVGGGAVVGALTNGGADPWFLSLQKPWFNPPSWIFAPVWTSLYALMGIAAWRVWRRGGWSVQRVPLAIFIGQLVLNFAWSGLFFNAHQITFALVDIALLWVMIVLTIRRFAPVDTGAAWLLSPYLAWVSFAALLNFSFARLN